MGGGGDLRMFSVVPISCFTVSIHCASVKVNQLETDNQLFYISYWKF